MVAPVDRDGFVGEGGWWDDLVILLHSSAGI